PGGVHRGFLAVPKSGSAIFVGFAGAVGCELSNVLSRLPGAVHGRRGSLAGLRRILFAAAERAPALTLGGGHQFSWAASRGRFFRGEASLAGWHCACSIRAS